MIEINATGLIHLFLTRFEIWQDVQEFYYKKDKIHLDINSQKGIPCFHYTDIESINKNLSPIKFIDCLTEGWHKNKYFRRYRDNCHYIFFSNGWWDTTLLDLPISYELVWNNYFLFDLADTHNSPNRFCYYLDKKYQFDYPKQCLLVSTIGNVRKERDCLVDQLKESKIIKKSIVRYSGQNIGIDCDLDVLNFKKGEFDPYTPILGQHYHNVSQSIPIQIYNQAYVNLIVETDAEFNHTFFLTEKTIKVLSCGMPFIILSTPKFLENLKKLGFKTYSSLWDESYDQIENFKERIDSIMMLLEQLQDFDWQHNKEQIEKISLHNQIRFWNLQDLADEEMQKFQSVLLRISDKNMC